MTLPPGNKLGAYEIVYLVGVGGRGEVYKARDTPLERIVAVKILAAHLAGNTAARERFEREASVDPKTDNLVGNLQHEGGQNEGGNRGYRENRGGVR